MNKQDFTSRLSQWITRHRQLLERKNEQLDTQNGIFERYSFPVLTREHTPLFWRYDLDYQRNPFLMERMGINATFNSGAIELNDTVYLLVRVEGVDRKSFFAVAESPTGIDRFQFWDYPITMPETDDPDVNVYDMRIVQHQDGWIYGIFCTERKDPKAPIGDTSAAVAQAGIARTRDMKTWERLDDLKTKSAQQRNVVLHPEFVNGQYAFYTRPQDDFIQAGSGGGIGWGLCKEIEHAVIEEETIVQSREYHTIYELKNGLGPAPIKTEKGWLNLAHGVRNTAAGLRYVLYLFLCDLNHPEQVTHLPGGYFLVPEGEERIGDVSNVVFSNGWVARKNGEVLIYYASSDTRQHVASSNIERLLDYVIHTPPDGKRSPVCVQQRKQLIAKNLEIMKTWNF